MSEDAAARALLALAAELDRKAAETAAETQAHATRGDDDAGRMAYGASGAWRAAAEMARQRAQASPGAASATPLVPEDPELTLVGLSPAQAYWAGVKAERERIARQINPAQLELLADWFDTDDEFKTTMFPEKWPPGSRADEVQQDLRRWAKVLRGDLSASQPASYQGVVDLIGGRADSGEVPRP